LHISPADVTITAFICDALAIKLRTFETGQGEDMTQNMTKYEKHSLLSYADKQAVSQLLNHLKALQLINATKVIYWWVNSEGWRWSPLRFYENQLSTEFDLKYGTDTRLRADLDSLDIEGANRDHGVYYQASPVYSTRKALRQLNIDYSTYTFVDFGSGKGRTLLLASELPFMRVIGIEFARELHEVAQKNIEIYPGKAAEKVESICQDATTFELPAENLIIYFFNPFDDVILDKVISNISNSLKSNPRSSYIVYHYVPNIDLLLKYGFRLVKQWRRYHIFEWEGEEGYQSSIGQMN